MEAGEADEADIRRPEAHMALPRGSFETLIPRSRSRGLPNPASASSNTVVFQLPSSPRPLLSHECSSEPAMVSRGGELSNRGEGSFRLMQAEEAGGNDDSMQKGSARSARPPLHSK